MSPTSPIPSSAAMSNASGASAGDYVYYPYGETFYASGSEKYRFTDQELDNEHGLYNYNARNYDPVLGRFISPDSIVQDFSDPQTLNRYSYCRNNPVMYVDPSGHIFLIDDILIGALIGAVIGAGTSAATGGDIAMGALTGAIGGAFFGAAGGIIQGLQNGAITGVCQIVSPGMQAGMHAAAGAMSGGINAAITGGNVGMGALTGGISGGISKYAGSFLPNDFGSQLAGRSLIGGLTGGISAELYGGKFGQGFGQGALTAGIGLFCNDWHEDIKNWFSEQFGTKGMTRRLDEFTRQQEKLFFSSDTPFVSEKTYRGIAAALMVGDASASCGIAATMITTGGAGFGFPGVVVGTVFSLPLLYNCANEPLHAYRLGTNQKP